LCLKTDVCCRNWSIAVIWCCNIIQHIKIHDKFKNAFSFQVSNCIYRRFSALFKAVLPLKCRNSIPKLHYEDRTNSDGQQFHQKNNHLSPQAIEYKKKTTSQHMVLDIQVLAWDRHTYVTGSYWGNISSSSMFVKYMRLQKNVKAS
jgi:hypothetical protein